MKGALKYANNDYRWRHLASALALYNPDPGFNTGQEGNLESLSIKNSPGGKAISKGIFTVWTVPEDPSPCQSY